MCILQQYCLIDFYANKTIQKFPYKINPIKLITWYRLSPHKFYLICRVFQNQRDYKIVKNFLMVEIQLRYQYLERLFIVFIYLSIFCIWFLLLLKQAAEQQNHIIQQKIVFFIEYAMLFLNILGWLCLEEFKFQICEYYANLCFVTSYLRESITYVCQGMIDNKHIDCQEILKFYMYYYYYVLLCYHKHNITIFFIKKPYMLYLVSIFCRAGCCFLQVYVQKRVYCNRYYCCIVSLRTIQKALYQRYYIIHFVDIHFSQKESRFISHRCIEFFVELNFIVLIILGTNINMLKKILSFVL
eukprot:TRINITY_DN5477_c0_g1_i2.p1 TRINITY_DN5477_c0_g1~~TRINITY_DN5477_c0_g1_i2.p1  ORF type:complete len:299 (+),score=-33.46 TRINITY_DN5477_c0_g1_i2:971-1867(+)